MEREEVLNVVKKHLVNALDINESDIDPNESMKTYGASSLDIVEVVSSSMRELRIKIPRSELADIKNINGLVDKLYEHKDAS